MVTSVALCHAIQHIVLWDVPALRFSKCQLALFEALDAADLAVEAVLEAPGRFGVQFEGGERLEGSRAGFFSWDGPSSDDGSVRSQVMPLVWGAFEPDEVTLASTVGAWSVGLDVPYDDARRGLALRSVGSSKFYDAAVLADGWILPPSGGTQWPVKVEFGVVTSAELVERLREPKMGMFGRSEERPSAVMPVEEAAEVSVYVEAAVQPSSTCAKGDGVDGIFRASEAAVGELVTEIAWSVSSELKGS